ncbi:MAG: ATP-binding cassette domain-containing protein [Acidobacteria bacterium]|nr:ATP-binding cassette domain-containing protein [Acidobacteriota bacterium]
MIEARIKKTFAASPGSAGFTLDIAFTAQAGVTVLFGPSGAGKTLTLDALAGFLAPDEGRILLDDQILFDGATRVNLPPQRRNCGYVFQNYALFPHMTLRQNLEFAAERRPPLERHRRVNEMLEKFALTGVASRRPGEVSGGQQQRCSIARALIGAPRMLLLDEPSRGLDAPLRAGFYQAVRQVREEFALPIVLVTHDLEECFELGGRMLVLREGRLAQQGSPREITVAPASAEVAQLLGGYSLLDAEILALDPGRNTSRLRLLEATLGAAEIAGPYLPGHFRGDRVQLCLRQDALRGQPRQGGLGVNQVAVQLIEWSERPRGSMARFNAGLAAEVSLANAEAWRHLKDWLIEIPAEAVRAL